MEYLPKLVIISNIEHDCTLSNRNFILKMKKPKNLGFEPVHPKTVLFASVVHGISCLFWSYFIRFGKRNNFVEGFFQFVTFFVEKTQFENSIFYNNTIRSSWFPPKNRKTLIFEFSNRAQKNKHFFKARHYRTKVPPD
jgi:hypothetical protein